MQVTLDLSAPEVLAAIQFATDRYNAEQGKSLDANSFVHTIAAEMIANWQTALAASLRSKLESMTAQQVIGLREQIDAAASE